MKEHKLTGKPAFYSVLYNSMKEEAYKLGYALALHGSLHTDMDLIAVAWIEDAKPIKELVKAISKCLGGTVWDNFHFTNFAKKPHGRIVYTLSINGDWFIDLSIVGGINDQGY